MLILTTKSSPFHSFHIPSHKSISSSVYNKLNQFLFVAAMVLSTISASATNYYVSNSGSDSNPGTSESKPWKTLNKVNSFTPKPGDQVLFQRGGEWAGTLTVRASGASGSPIVYGAYGSGEKPKIYGSEKITGWTKHSGNVYKAAFSAQINQLFLNNTRMKAARFPNTGYVSVNTVNSAQSFTCDALNGSINYAGATWIGRTVAYATVTLNVVSSSGKTLTLSSAPYANLNPNEGFIVVNKLEFLDSPGEWYYDNNTRTVYFWTPNSDTPANYTVSGSTMDYGIVLSGKSHVTVKDFEIRNNKKYGITLSGSNITVDNNTIANPDSRGIDVASGSNCTISNNEVSGANHSGIFTYSNNCIITDNKIDDTFLLNNIGISGGGAWYMGSGISVEGNDNLVKYNRVFNSGYNGICFYKRNIIEYNYVKNSVLSKDDGGGIYSAAAGSYPNPPTAGSIIRHNIVDGVFGTLEGWDKWVYRGGHGIFLDENAGGVTIEGNTVVNGSHTCIFIHYSFNETIKNNTLMSARRVFLVGTDYGGSTFTNNIVYTLNRDIDNKDIQWQVSKYKGDIQMNYNTYISHYNSSNVFRLDEVTNYSFEGWKAATKQDANSTIDVTRFVNGETEEIFYNDTKQTKTFNLGNSVYKDINGQQVPQSLVLAPFKSKILIKTKAVIAVDNTPPTVNSFTIPNTSSSFIVPVSSFSANDNYGVTGYKITESSNVPGVNDIGWNANAPSSYTFISEGAKTLYAWAKDGSGNISKSVSDQVVITLNNPGSGDNGNIDVPPSVSTAPNRRATPVTFDKAAVIESISIYHNGGTGGVLTGIYADQAGSPSIQLGVSSSTSINSSEGWQRISLKSPVAVNAGQTIWLSWVFENNPGIRYSTGTPGRAQSTQTWSSGMPSSFGASDFSDFTYSIYCTSVEPSLAVSNTSVLLDENSGASSTFDILSNVSWSISENADWLIVSKTTGSNNGTITVSANSANTGLNPRTAELTIVGQTGTSKTIAITQKNQPLRADSEGIFEVFTSTSTSDKQRAIPVIFTEEGKINSISIYHNGGSGRILLGVYSDNNDLPAMQLGTTPATVIATAPGWQTVNLTTPVSVSSGQKVWLSWLFENNPGIRYSSGTPGRAESSSTWSSGMANSFVTSNFVDYNYSIYCSYTPGLTSGLIGNTEVYNGISTAPNRRAISVTPTETGLIESVSIYHNGGSGNVLLGVYSDNFGSPYNLLGVTESNIVKSTSGWQTIYLTSPVAVNTGQTIWLSWVFENNPGVRYSSGAPGRAQSTQTWSAGMPSSFGTSDFSEFTYSIYCTIVEPSLAVSNTSVLLDENSGASSTIDILSNVGWSISENTDWLNVSKSTGSNNQTITISANSANTGLNLRTAELMIVGQAGTGKTITITQKNQTLSTDAAGTFEVFTSTSTSDKQRAIPVIFTEEGEINSISIYHNGGTGRVLLGVYSDNNDFPATQLGTTPATVIAAAPGWQTVNLTTPVSVASGQKIWLSWLFENNPGVRYSSGTPGRAESSSTWSSGMSNSFVTSNFEDYNYSIYCSYTPGIASGLVGNKEVYNSVSTVPNRRAISITPTETGTIESISIYHDGGTGNVMLGVYSDNNGFPSNQLGVTSSTTINSTQGWQTISLTNPVQVVSGQTVWLSWVFQNNPGIRYTVGSPGRVQSEATWSSGMPSNFGISTNTNYEYSVYCTIKPGITNEGVGNKTVFDLTSTEIFMRASPVYFNQAGTINSISIYHNGGSGNLLLGIYSDQTGSPSSKLGTTPPTKINSNEGWQTVYLERPVSVNPGQTVWLSWLFENNPGVRYSSGNPGRVQSTGTWSQGMPSNFGSSSFAAYNYSIYCSYTPNKTILKGAEIPIVEEIVAGDAELPATAFNANDTHENSLIESSLFQSTDLDFKLYPNPAKSYVNIDLGFVPDITATIELVDAYGRTVEQKLAESTSIRIETNQLTRGIYFVRITNNNNVKVKKLIIE